MSTKNKIDIIQFLPYFPPHKGGLETVAEEIGIHWRKNDLGVCINIVTHFEQENEFQKNENLEFEGNIIGYKKYGVENLVVPSFEIINNFPVYKIWSREYRCIKKYLILKCKNKENNCRIITHTRFFLTSFIGGSFSRKNNMKWIHIEHGSDYVKLSSNFKTSLAYLYDRIIGKWVFKKADRVLAISNACKTFIQNEFVKRDVDVFYRGICIPEKTSEVENLKERFPEKIVVGYIGRLYKWKNVSSLIQAYYSLDRALQNKLQLIIVGDGEDYQNLVNQDGENKIYFTGGRSFDDALSYQKQFDIHIHPSSPGGGLATTLLQAMKFGYLIVATPNEGAKEVIIDGKNGILLKNDSVEEIHRGIILAIKKIGSTNNFQEENKRIIKNKFSWKKNIIELYKKIL